MIITCLHNKAGRHLTYIYFRYVADHGIMECASAINALLKFLLSMHTVHVLSMNKYFTNQSNFHHKVPFLLIYVVILGGFCCSS